MDAPDADLDVKLHKMSGELLAELDVAIRRVGRKGDASRRGYVRARETLQVATTTLDMFQELPQLLDPHLAAWIPLLSSAYLRRCVGAPEAGCGGSAGNAMRLVPLDYAICRILYSFCKVRGEKVVVRLLSAETRYLEALLAAMERAEQQPADDSGGDAWQWEQRYVVMLWLSHLLLAPFDLASISSVDGDAEELPAVAGFAWSEQLPGITTRIVPLGIKYVGVPGKERDAAVALLVRTAMRRDMQQLGVLDGLVRWALDALRAPSVDDGPLHSSYYYIGVLSLLSGLLRSAGATSDMDAYLARIFDSVYGMTTRSDALATMLMSLAVVRKLMLKVLRAVVVGELGRAAPLDMAAMERVEATIGHLVDSLADADTPVRLAGSKSLSIIALKLDADMAAQVVEAVLEALRRNVLWTGGGGRTRDLSAVNALEWHGLTMTLAHLVYRRSPPAGQLADVVHCLLVALSFEQRSTSGSSVGTNVRDAACFGIWAIARRYSSSELGDIPTGHATPSDHVLPTANVPTANVPTDNTAPTDSTVPTEKIVPTSNGKPSILQLLATELVTAACLDPAGNIRRGASAALQELIGRHPDAVQEGIPLVQTVDYHAVARRSRALQQVSVGAAQLSPIYAEAIINGILGWRGVGDADAPSRRAAGAAFGLLTAEMALVAPHRALPRIEAAVDTLMDRLASLAQRQVDERHGLLICFASVLNQLPRVLQAAGEHGSAEFMHAMLARVTTVVQDCRVVGQRKPELVAEGASKLVVSALPVIHAVALPGVSHQELLDGHELLPALQSRGIQLREYMKLISALDSCDTSDSHIVALVSELRAAMPAWLSRNEMETVEPVAAAALLLLLLSTPGDRAETLQSWADAVRTKPASRAATTGLGFFHALALAQPLAERCDVSQDGMDVSTDKAGPSIDKTDVPENKALESKDKTDAPAYKTDLVCEALVQRWRNDAAVETRTALLGSLTRSRLVCRKPLAFQTVLQQGLDDYTTTARGDVGSHIRVQALRAVYLVWEHIAEDAEWAEASIKRLLGSTLRLAAEKLDRVRVEAQLVVALTLKPDHAQRFRSLTCSSKAYFDMLLNLLSQDMMQPHFSTAVEPNGNELVTQLLAGFVTSADTGNDELVMASRAALTDFCASCANQLEAVWKGLLDNLGRRPGEDRIVVPTLETAAFLLSCGLYQQDTCATLCARAQRAGYKSGNMRKVLACVRVYGGVATMTASAATADGESRMAAAAAAAAGDEARKRLGALMSHPWPRVRNAVVDQLWGLFGCCCVGGDDDDGAAESRGGRLLGVDWAKADRATTRAVVHELRLE